MLNGFPLPKMGIFGHGHSHGHGHGHGHGVVQPTKNYDEDDEEAAPGGSSRNHRNRPPVGEVVAPVHEHARARDITRLLRQARPEFCLVLMGSIALLLSAGVNLLVPFSIGQLIDESAGGLVTAATAGRNNGTSTSTSEGPSSPPSSSTSAFGIDFVLLLCLAFVAGSLFTFVRGVCFALAGEKLVRRLRQQLFSALMVQDVAFFDGHRTGDLLNRLSADTALVQQAVTITLGFIVRFGLQIVGGTVLLLWLSWALALVMLAPVPVIGLGALLYGRFASRLQRRVQEALGKTMQTAEESISSLRYVRAFGKEDQEMRRYEGAVAETYVLGRRMAAFLGLYQGGVEFVAYTAILLVIWFGSVQLGQRAITFGELTSFLLYTIYVSHALGAFSSHTGEFMRAVGASRRIFEIIDAQPEMPISGGAKLPKLRGNVRFHDVTFSYPTRPSEKVLDAVSLQLKPGKIVAVVGPSGGGKSTLINLILRLYDPSAGKITLDGTDIRELDPRWLRDQVGLVPQDPTLFAVSVRENICYGKPLATQKEVEAAARAAHAHEFISALPEGYDTLVGERGVRLSGGQLQRVAIARAIVKNPRIILFDEATSSLDAESEHAVQMAMNDVLKGRAVLVVAHRLSTVASADLILVVQGGAVVARGTHQELMAEDNGIYARLVRRQLLNETDLAIKSPSTTAAAAANKKRAKRKKK